jgi:hypothetical protein
MRARHGNQGAAGRFAIEHDAALAGKLKRLETGAFVVIKWGWELQARHEWPTITFALAAERPEKGAADTVGVGHADPIRTRPDLTALVLHLAAVH